MSRRETAAEPVRSRFGTPAMRTGIVPARRRIRGGLDGQGRRGAPGRTGREHAAEEYLREHDSRKNGEHKELAAV